MEMNHLFITYIWRYFPVGMFMVEIGERQVSWA